MDCPLQRGHEGPESHVTRFRCSRGWPLTRSASMHERRFALTLNLSNNDLTRLLYKPQNKS
jgi:hypothetical protein